LNLSELEFDDEYYYLECRCSGHYSLPQEKATPGQLAVCCDSCSLAIIVTVNSESIKPMSENARS